ncbi:MAG: hypothetical protein IJ228_09630 [Succinivibrio sp.]|nr:hypothetical protein [Succinivibrio sp.]
MKKLLKISLLAALFTTFQAAAAPCALTQTALEQGSVTTYNCPTLKLHAYQSGDPLSDELYALESAKGLVLLESTALTKNVELFAAYLKSLHKPLAGALLSYHPNGYSHFDTEVFATKGAVKSWQEGSVKALTEQFTQAFGADQVAGDLPSDATELKFGETLKLAGMEFEIVNGQTPEGHYDVVIPALNAVYTHMMGGKVHNILPSVAAIDAEIARFEDYLEQGYELILTSHYVPEGPAAAQEKVTYLKRVRELAESERSRGAFIAAVKESFPGYEGENYLEMSAGMLFKK